MSELRANTISDAAGTGPVTLTGQYAAKAWVNFDGTGTVAIRQSGNVASITDNGTGDYSVNFTAALTDADYSYLVSFTGAYNTSSVLPYGAYLNATASATESAPTTGSFRFVTSRQAGVFDSKYINAATFR